MCYAEADGLSYWIYLTGTPHPLRRSLDRKWLRVPPGGFRSCDVLIIGDVRCSFVGPIDAFAELSREHDIFKGMRRPFLLEGGVDEVQMMVRSRGGLLPPPQRNAA